jgi:hypothetical protein
MKIDVRNKQCVYIKIDDYTFYIDNSTNEQIMNFWHKNDPVDTVRNTNPEIRLNQIEKILAKYIIKIDKKRREDTYNEAKTYFKKYKSINNKEEL